MHSQDILHVHVYVHDLIYCQTDSFTEMQSLRRKQTTYRQVWSEILFEARLSVRTIVSSVQALHLPRLRRVEPPSAASSRKHVLLQVRVVATSASVERVSACESGRGCDGVRRRGGGRRSAAVEALEHEVVLAVAQLPQVVHCSHLEAVRAVLSTHAELRGQVPAAVRTRVVARNFLREAVSGELRLELGREVGDGGGSGDGEWAVDGGQWGRRVANLLDRSLHVTQLTGKQIHVTWCDSLQPQTTTCYTINILRKLRHCMT